MVLDKTAQKLKNNPMKIYNYSIQILEFHLDSFGHVNNAVYLQLYEQARWDLIDSFNLGMKDIKKNKQGPIILEVNLKFKKELINREHIKIQTKAVEIKKNKFMILDQQIIKEDGSISSEAIFTIGFMDFSERKLIDLPKSWLNVFA